MSKLGSIAMITLKNEMLCVIKCGASPKIKSISHTSFILSHLWDYKPWYSTKHKKEDMAANEFGQTKSLITI